MDKVDLSVLDRSISALQGQCCGEGELARELEDFRGELAEFMNAALDLAVSVREIGHVTL